MKILPSLVPSIVSHLMNPWHVFAGTALWDAQHSARLWTPLRPWTMKSATICPVEFWNWRWKKTHSETACLYFPIKDYPSEAHPVENQDRTTHSNYLLARLEIIIRESCGIIHSFPMPRQFWLYMSKTEIAARSVRLCLPLSYYLISVALKILHGWFECNWGIPINLEEYGVKDKSCR